MVVLSAILYFFNHHSLLAMPVIWLICGGIGAGLAQWRKNPAWFGLGIAGFVLGMLNPFFGSTINGSFLNAFGTYGSAVITHSEQTNSQLNDQYIDAYDAVMRTADGRDVAINFDTMSATLYPWRNRIDIPPTGERFVIKYIPGFERNIVILRDESPFGKRLLMREARKPVDRAAARLEASPDNEAFQREYQDALQRFRARYGSEADPAIDRDMGDRLQANRQAAMAREMVDLGSRPIDDAYYERFQSFIARHGKDADPGMIAYLAVQARQPVTHARDEWAAQPDDAALKHRYHDAIRQFLDRYGAIDSGYARYLRQELQR